MPQNGIEKLITRREPTPPSAKTLFTTSEPSLDWMRVTDEGQLAIDVYQKDNAIVIRAPIAGVKAEDLDIAIQQDMVTIRGARSNDAAVTDDDYFYRECYWGAFSRSIILPTDIRAEDAKATMHDGVLTITLPKATTRRTLTVKTVS